MTERGVSTVLDYAMTLAIAAILMSALIFAAGEFVGSNRERVVETELRVIGQQIASDVQTADRLVQANRDDDHMKDLTMNQSVPDTVAGSSYTVEVYVRSNDEVELRLRTTTPSTNVTVEVLNRTEIEPNTLTQGDYAITYDASETKLEVVDD